MATTYEEIENRMVVDEEWDELEYRTKKSILEEERNIYEEYEFRED